MDPHLEELDTPGALKSLVGPREGRRSGALQILLSQLDPKFG